MLLSSPYIIGSWRTIWLEYILHRSPKILEVELSRFSEKTLETRKWKYRHQLVSHSQKNITQLNFDVSVYIHDNKYIFKYTSKISGSYHNWSAIPVHIQVYSARLRMEFSQLHVPESKRSNL